MHRLATWMAALFVLATVWRGAAEPAAANSAPRPVVIIPVRQDIMPPLVYLVRRGVKEAMEKNAEALILDMDTNGGRVDVTEEIIQIIGQFKGRTLTYVDKKAFSAGAFISVATQQIFMAPQSVIGAAAPIMAGPEGAQSLPDTVEAKMTSAIRALVRATAEKNGHNVAVIEAMIDKSRELKMDDVVLNEKGQILTLTDRQASQTYGKPPKPLLSAGTFETLDDLLKELRLDKMKVVRVESTGVEKIAVWLTAISPILLIIGVGGIYLEMKTPGFGLPGIVGITALALYFLGGYIAGLSGLEWAAVFFLGLALLVAELFFFPGLMVLGIGGVILMFIAVLMAMVDFYPGMPSIPSLPQLRLPMQNLLIAAAGGVVLILALARFLPGTSLFRGLVSSGASGETAVLQQEKLQASNIGLKGVALSNLRPGGKARFGDQTLNVMTRGEMIEKDTPVRIVGSSGPEAVVEADIA